MSPVYGCSSRTFFFGMRSSRRDGLDWANPSGKTGQLLVVVLTVLGAGGVTTNTNAGLVTFEMFREENEFLLSGVVVAGGVWVGCNPQSMLVSGPASHWNFE